MSKNKINRFKQSKLLFGASLKALKHDKQLIILPVIGMIITSLLLVCTTIMAYLNPDKIFYVLNTTTGKNDIKLLSYLSLIVIGLLTTVINTFISAALINGALQRFDGKNPTTSNSLTAVKKKFWPLIAFATMNFGIGRVLSELSEKLPLGGKIFTFLANTTWSVASFFSLPIIMRDNKSLNPIKATKKSVTLIKKTWGESLIISATLGLYITLIVITYLILTSVLCAMAFYYISATIGILMTILVIIGLISLDLIFNTLNSFAKAAIYYYAVTGKSPVQFNREILEATFTRKQARKVFNI